MNYSGQRRYCLSVVLMLFSGLTLAQIYNKEIEAKLDISFNDEFINIVASGENKTPIDKSLRYVMSGFVQMDDGSSVKEDQEERFVLSAGEKRNLNSITLPRRDERRKIILLLIYDENEKIVGKDRVVFYGDDKNDPDLFKFEIEEVKNEQELNDEPDGIVLTGLVIENTKTRPARDFYREYYANYLSKNVNSEFIITIEELLALGTNTKVEVKVGETLVWQFFVNPRSDYIKEMADIALSRTIRFLQQQKRDQNNIKKY
ncbi:CsgE family curli-type amyloid fiber assembly protein [Gilvibacter sediminis]|uniref:CsgE family curli-type amyloid fiber assembly protein n=1 Tax=Gilvibacter sediminis TaxID=379071 RepID=UPI00234FBA21|nr:CsgE family curli-type amyloid fiber assembly protein [Gilvibacter sediminis]MDC7999346.1 CsgE family curli-type amyloid fiber assembly protein [Gilvibacter sediminis]